MSKKIPEWTKQTTLSTTKKNNVKSVKNQKDTILTLIDDALGITDAIDAGNKAFAKGNNFWLQAESTYTE